MYRNIWSVFKYLLGVTIVSNEIESADRIIVHGTGIYETVVVNARASECFFFLNIEEERLISWLVVTLQSRKGKILWFEYSIIKGGRPGKNGQNDQFSAFFSNSVLR